MRKQILIVCVLSVIWTLGLAQDNRIEYNGQDLFLSGGNVAWVNFASDIGPGETNFAEFGRTFKETHSYGANCQRLWLHTNGTSTPEFTVDTVSGPGAGAIDDLRQILDSAYKYDVGLILCLWSFDMLRLEIGEPYLTRNRALLENDTVLNSYIENALIPMVDSLKDHPGIVAWEVFNEPEGMIEGATWGGWGDIGHVTREQVQNVVNKIAGAIHRVSTNLKVTNGTHTLHSLTSVDEGDHNFYSDSALFNVGGDVDGYLDFYQVHYYDFPLSPFAHEYSYWELDKPLIIGEFYPNCNTCGDFSNYETLIENGYAGALGWMWREGTRVESIRNECQYTFLNHTAIVDIDNNLGDAPFLYYSGPEDAAEYETGSSVNFSLEAFDTDGTIDTVIYYVSADYAEYEYLTSFGEATDSIYNYTWDNPADGVYRVFATVWDNDGLTKSTNVSLFTIGDPPNFRYEAEEAELSGDVFINNDAEASGGKYVKMEEDGCSVLWTVTNCPADGSYELKIGYSAPYGDKNNYLTVNGDVNSQQDLAFVGDGDNWLELSTDIEMIQGENTIEITDFWGWMHFDYIELPFARPEEPDFVQAFTANTSLNIYPNPAKDNLLFRANESIVSVEIYDMQGKVVLVENSEAIEAVDISALAKGIYLIHVQTLSGNVSRELLMKE